MPLVITCPHDGRAEPPGVPERPDDQAGCLTKKQADLSTRTIALGLSSAVQALMGLEPSMVVARFHRRYIDANRPEKCAFVAREARPLYREYHNRITAAIRSTVKQFPRRGILVDIHGAADLSEEPDTHVLLGTDGGESIARLLELDPRILFRRQGLVLSLQSWGIRSDSGERRAIRSMRASTVGSPSSAMAPRAPRASMPCRSRSFARCVWTRPGATR